MHRMTMMMVHAYMSITFGMFIFYFSFFPHKQPNLGRVVIYKMSRYCLLRNTKATDKITQHEVITLMRIFDHKLLLHACMELRLY